MRRDVEERMALAKSDLQEVEEVAPEQVATQMRCRESNLEFELPQFCMRQTDRMDECLQRYSRSGGELCNRRPASKSRPTIRAIEPSNRDRWAPESR